MPSNATASFAEGSLPTVPEAQMLGLVRSSPGAPAPAVPLPATVAALGLQQVGGSNIAPVCLAHTVWLHCIGINGALLE